MRRHPKAPSGVSISGAGTSRAPFGISSATRGVSGDADGRGAPFYRKGMLALLVGIAALLVLPVASASATLTVNLTGPGTGTVVAMSGANILFECSNTPGKEKLGPANCSTSETTVNVRAFPDKPFILGPWSGSEAGTCDSHLEPECKFDPLNPLGPNAVLDALFRMPPELPSVSTGVAGNVTDNQALIPGEVNPNSDTYAVTRCQVEYGLTIAYGKFASCQPSTLPPGTTAVPVSTQLGVLAPSTTYHYRVVARNVSGTSVGADRTFTTSAAPADSCPNAAIRAQQGSFFLGDCRAYEMVSPPYKQTQEARLAMNYLLFQGGAAPMSPNGDAVGWSSLGLFAGAESSINGSTYLSKRSAEGWETVSTNAPFSVIGSGGGLATLNTVAKSRDMLGTAQCGYASPVAGPGEVDKFLPAVCAVQGAAGAWRSTGKIFPYDNWAQGGGEWKLNGASDDLSHLTVTSSLRVVPEDTASGFTRSLYDVFAESPTKLGVRLVNVGNNGNLIGSGGAELGGQNGRYRYRAISADGDRIFFTATPAGGVATLYARSGGVTTTVSNPSPAECTTCDSTLRAAGFWGASADGSRVFFSTAQQLVDADSDATNDLYIYDFDAPPGRHLIQASAGGAGDLTPGTEAKVTGVAAVSEDGSRIYFFAQDLLTSLPNGLGQSAVKGAENLYVYERDSAFPTGRTSFVATVSSADVARLNSGLNEEVQTTPDGSYLVFTSTDQLIGAGPEVDTDAAVDIYRYEALSGDLVRISVGRPDYPASSNGNTAGMTAVFEGTERGVAGANGSGQGVSADGSYVVFVTGETLQAEDVNGAGPVLCGGGDTPGCDVYLWHDGDVQLVSTGIHPGGSSQVTGRGRVSASGSVVMFSTYTQLVPQDTDQLSDIYAARIDGGFPYTPPTPRCESNEACHGSPPQPPPGEVVGGSSTFSGPGNQPAPPVKPKKKKKKHKKQHGKKHKKAAKQKTSTRGNG